MSENHAILLVESFILSHSFESSRPTKLVFFPSRLPPLPPHFRHHQLPSECVDEFTTISSSLSYVERIVELSSNPICSSPGGALHLHVHLHNSPLKRASLPPLQGTMTGLRVRPKLPPSVLLPIHFQGGVIEHPPIRSKSLYQVAFCSVFRVKLGKFCSYNYQNIFSIKVYHLPFSASRSVQ